MWKLERIILNIYVQTRVIIQRNSFNIEIDPSNSLNKLK